MVISAAPQRGGHAGSFQGQDGPFCEEPSCSLPMSARVSAKCSGFPQDQDVHSMVSMQSVPWTKCTDKDLDRALGRCSREDDVSNTENFPVGYISQPARPKRYFSVFIYTYKIKMLHLWAVLKSCCSSSLQCRRPWYRKNNTDGPLFSDLISSCLLHL